MPQKNVVLERNHKPHHEKQAMTWKIVDKYYPTVADTL